MKQSFDSRRLLFVLAVAAITAAGCGDRDNGDEYDSSEAAGTVALPDTTPPAGATSDVPTTDAGAVEFLRTVDNGEVEAGQLAQSKASNAEVKRFARTMVSEHRSHLNRIERLNVGTDTSMAQDSSTIVHTLHAKHQQTVERLRNLSGAEFDNEYMTHQVNDHQQVLSILQQLQGRAQNSDLQRLIGETVTTVQKHLDRAREVQLKLSGTAGDTARQE